MSKRHEQLFGRTGTEGMLDVILACTLIFLLISCLIRVGSDEAQEKVLPAIKLSSISKKIAGTTSIKKSIITLKAVDRGNPQIFLDEKQISMEELSQKVKELKNSGINHVSLRRGNNITCEWEDKIIIMCRQAGIERVGIVVKESTEV